MKHRSPTGRVTYVAAPIEPAQGVQPSEAFTLAARQVAAVHHPSGRVKVEGMGASRAQLERTRVTDDHLGEQERAAHVLHQQDQARGLASSLGFEERARAAGVMGRVTPAMRFRLDQARVEREYVYPRTTR